MRNMLAIRYTLLATKDLEEIFQYIAQEYHSRAEKFIVNLQKKIELLSHNPEMGNRCKNRDIKQECRMLVYKNHMILYRFDSTKVTIIRVIHQKQNYKG